MTTDSFYVLEDVDRFASTEWTIGPWSPAAQHGGPPAALLSRAIDKVNDRSDMQIVRVTFDILRPVPIETLAVEARVVRPGKNVELVHASLSVEEQPVMKAAAWRIRTRALDIETPSGPVPPALPAPGEPVEVFPASTDKNYLAAMEWRLTRGAFIEPGPAATWARMRHPLIAGEGPSQLSRALVLADSGNGISSQLDFERWMFINPDLTVCLHRMPEGEWLHLDATTTLQTTGIGLASSMLSDRQGEVGRGLQSLLVSAR